MFFYYIYLGDIIDVLGGIMYVFICICLVLINGIYYFVFSYFFVVFYGFMCIVGIGICFSDCIIFISMDMDFVSVNFDDVRVV